MSHQPFFVTFSYYYVDGFLNFLSKNREGIVGIYVQRNPCFVSGIRSWKGNAQFH